jgi:hypothetical protein
MSNKRPKGVPKLKSPSIMKLTKHMHSLAQNPEPHFINYLMKPHSFQNYVPNNYISPNNSAPTNITSTRTPKSSNIRIKTARKLAHAA